MHVKRHLGSHDKKSPGMKLRESSHSLHGPDMRHQHSYRHGKSHNRPSYSSHSSRVQNNNSRPTLGGNDLRHASEGKWLRPGSGSDRRRPVSRSDGTAFRNKPGSRSPMPLPRSSSTEKTDHHVKEPSKRSYRIDNCSSLERRPRSRSPVSRSRSRSGPASREWRTERGECTDSEKMHIKSRESPLNANAFSDNLWSSGHEREDAKHERYSPSSQSSAVKNPEDNRHDSTQQFLDQPRRRKPSRWSDEKVDLSNFCMLNVAKTDSASIDVRPGSKVTAKKGEESAKNGHASDDMPEKLSKGMCNWIDGAPWMNRKQGSVNGSSKGSSQGVQDEAAAKVAVGSIGSVPAVVKSPLLTSPAVNQKEFRPKTSAAYTSTHTTSHQCSSVPGKFHLVSSLDKTGLSMDPCVCALTEAENLRSLRLSRFLQESLGSCGSITSHSSSQSNSGEMASDDSSPSFLPPPGMPMMPVMDLPTSSSGSDTSKRLGVKPLPNVAPVHHLPMPGHVFLNLPKPGQPLLPNITSPNKMPNTSQPSFANMTLNLCSPPVNGIPNVPSPVPQLPIFPMNGNLIPPMLLQSLPPPSIPVGVPPHSSISGLPSNIDLREIGLKHPPMLDPQILQGLADRQMLNGGPPLLLPGFPNLQAAPKMPAALPPPPSNGIPDFVQVPGMPNVLQIPTSNGLPGISSNGLPPSNRLQLSNGLPPSSGLPPVNTMQVPSSNGLCANYERLPIMSPQPVPSPSYGTDHKLMQPKLVHSSSPSLGQVLGEVLNSTPVVPSSPKKPSLPSVTNANKDSEEKELVKTVFVPVFYNPSVPPPQL